MVALPPTLTDNANGNSDKLVNTCLKAESRFCAIQLSYIGKKARTLCLLSYISQVRFIAQNSNHKNLESRLGAWIDANHFNLNKR